MSKTAATGLNLRLKEVKSAGKEDQEYQELYQVIQNGFPEEKGNLPEGLHKYWAVKHRLFIVDDIILFGCHTLIPKSLREKMLQLLHEGHQGINRTQNRARQILYWPGIDRDIEHIVLDCQQCQEELPSLSKEPMMSHALAEHCFQQVSADFASFAGYNFLIIIDHFTGWLCVFQCGRNATSYDVITCLRKMFCIVVVPDVIWSYGDPLFTSQEFTTLRQNRKWTFDATLPTVEWPC